MRSSFSPPWLAQHHGYLLDAMICAANLWLLCSFVGRAPHVDGEGSSGGEMLDPRLRWMLVAALTAYTLGAALKRAPFRARVPVLHAPAHAGCLCVAWLVLHLVLCVLAAAAVVSESAELPLVVRVVGMFALSVLPTAMAARILVRPKAAQPQAAWRTHPLREGIADALIAAAVLTSTWFWNEQVALLFFAEGPAAAFGDRLIGSVLAAGSFAMFYVAPRFLFLLEDHARWWTWLSMGATLVPLLARMWL